MRSKGPLGKDLFEALKKSLEEETVLANYAVKALSLSGIVNAILLLMATYLFLAEGASLVTVAFAWSLVGTCVFGLRVSLTLTDIVGVAKTLLDRVGAKDE